MDLSKITFLKVDILDNKFVGYFRRTGPLHNVTIPKSEYRFLTENGFEVIVKQVVYADGGIENIDHTEAVKAPEVFEEKVEETVVEEAASQTEVVEQPEQQESTEEEQPSEEEKSEEDAPSEEESSEEESAPEEQAEEEVKLPESLLDTIETSDDSISLHLLTADQYAVYTKAELLKFLKALTASLPDEIVKQIETERNISKKTLLEIIETHLLAD
jgi:hypothetical protein